MAKTPICPLMKKACIEHDCAWYAHMTGTDPQSGALMDHWDCAVKWLPVLITEQARQTRGVQAAVESFRNESIERQDVLNGNLNGVGQFMGIIQGVAQSKQIPQPPHVDRLKSDGG